MVRILLIAMLGLALSIPQGLMMGDAYSKSDTGGASKGSGKGKADKGGSKGAAGQKAGGQSKSKGSSASKSASSVGTSSGGPKGKSRRANLHGGTSGSQPGQGCWQASFWWFRFGNAQPRQARGVGKPDKGDCVTNR